MKSRQKKSHKRSHQAAHRKADISINTIIIAALGLLVLVVLIAVFTGRFGAFNVAVGQQQTDDTKCQSACSGLSGTGAEVKVATSCDLPKKLLPGAFGTGNVCCCNY